jgi:hydrogenase maturation protease
VPPHPPATGRTLIIGLGNPIVADDSIGLRVAAELKSRLADRPDVDVTEDYWGGLRLMERMIGYDRAIVIDAICTGAPPGTIHHLTTASVPTQKSASAHDVNLPTALAFGRRAGAHLPADEDVRLIGIEAEDLINFSDQCTPAVAAAIPRSVQEVIQLLDSMLEGQEP